ncbi:ATP-grasp domain-containing protein [Rhodovastum atsumiense]|nr:ATP-grasp domain-containing protein [Rhodovastum atsumiense]
MITRGYVCAYAQAATMALPQCDAGGRPVVSDGKRQCHLARRRAALPLPTYPLVPCLVGPTLSNCPGSGDLLIHWWCLLHNPEFSDSRVNRGITNGQDDVLGTQNAGCKMATMRIRLPVRDVLMVAEQSGIALKVLHCCIGAGLRVHILGGPQAAHLRHSRYTASFTLTDIPSNGPFESFAAAVEDAVQCTGASVVLPGDYWSTRALIRVAPGLRVPVFPLPDARSFDMLAEKWNFYCFCKSIDVPVPQTIWVGDKTCLAAAALGTRFGYPLVVKPTDQGNMDGVVIAHSAADLEQRVIGNPGYRYGNLIAQSFIPGDDIDCSVLAVDGRVLAAAVQRRIEDAIVFCDHSMLTNLVGRIVEASRFTGVAHFDARTDLRDGGIRLIECNPRFWASVDAAHWCGLNFVAIGLDAAIEPTAVAAVPDLVDGIFYPLGVALRRFLRFDARPLRSAATRGSLWQALGDPLPLVIDKIGERKGKRESAESVIA